MAHQIEWQGLHLIMLSHVWEQETKITISEVKWWNGMLSSLKGLSDLWHQKSDQCES